MTFKVETDLLNSIEKGESLVDSFSTTLASELKEKTNFSNPFYKKDNNPQGSKLISSVIAIALVLMIFLAGPATAFGVDWIINNGNEIINTGEYIQFDIDVSKITSEGFIDQNMVLDLNGIIYNLSQDCDWTNQAYDNNQFGYGYGYGYGSANTLVGCIFVADPITTAGSYNAKILLSGNNTIGTKTIEVIGSTIDIFDSNYLEVFTKVGNDYTADVNIAVSAVGASALIPTGTVISSSTGTDFNADALQALDSSNSSVSEIGAFDNGTVYETIQFGVPGITLYFSNPVEVRIPVSAANGTVLQVKRKGSDGIWTTNGLTTSAGTCASGIATPTNSSYTVTNGYIYVYTCQASDFTAYSQGTQVTSGGRTVTPVATTSQEPQEETVQPVDEAGPSMDDLVYETPSAPQDLDVDTVEQTSTPTGLFGFMGVGESELVPIILLVLAVGIIGFYFFKKRKK